MEGEEERLFKERLRARVRRVGKVLYAAAFVLGVFLASIQCTFLYGDVRAAFWLPAGIYCLAAAFLLGKGRPVLALICLAGIFLLASVQPKAAALKARRELPASAER